MTVKRVIYNRHLVPAFEHLTKAQEFLRKGMQYAENTGEHVYAQDLEEINDHIDRAIARMDRF